MDNRIRKAFDTLHAPPRLKRKALAQIRNRTFDYGRNVYRLRQHRQRAAAALLSLVLVITGGTLWFRPSASIAVDINPSMELTVNALDRVISLKGKNADGAEVVRDLNVRGMAYDDAMQRLLLSEGLEPYLDRNSGISITVTGGGSAAHAQQMLSRVLCRAYTIAGRDNILYCQVDWATARAAQEANLCIPRYLAWQKLLETDPDITPEEVRRIPKEQIRALAQTAVIDDPCREQG